MKRALRSASWVAAALALALHGWVVVSVLASARAHSLHEPATLAPPLRLFNDAVHRMGPGADFFALYHAAVLLGRGASPFALGNDPVTPHYYLYRYLPALAQAMRPVVQLVPPWTAFACWIAILELGLLATLVFVRRSFPSPWVPWLWALCLAYTPLWLELQMGQFSFMMGVLALATGLLLQERRTWLAQVPWLASMFLKVYSLVLIPVFLRRGSMGKAALSLLLFVGVNALAFAASPGTLQPFLQTNLAKVAVVPTDCGNFGFPFFTLLLWTQLLHQPLLAWTTLYRVMQVAMLALAAGVVLVRRPPPGTAIATLLLAHQVSYMQVWEHHYAMLLPVLLLLLRDVQHDRLAPLVLLGLVALALPSPFALWDVPALGATQMNGWPLGYRLALWGCKALPCLLLFGSGLVASWRGAAVSPFAAGGLIRGSTAEVRP